LLEKGSLVGNKMILLLGDGLAGMIAILPEIASTPGTSGMPPWVWY